MGDHPPEGPLARVAYLTGRYPAISHTFITREVAALRARAVDVHTFSIWATDPEQLLTDTDRDERRRTFAILPLRPVRALRAHWSALRGSPGAYAASLGRAVRLGRPGIRGRLLGLSWHVEAIVLWDELSRRGIRHVHAHLNGTAPSVALLSTSFANAVDGGADRWSWSMTIHGPSEFFDVHGERLVDKVRDADRVVCISDFTRSQVMALVDERQWSKLRVIHCGIDADLFEFERNGRPGAVELLNVARLTQVKGQAVLLHALETVRRRGGDARLTIVGDGPDRGALEALARRLGVEAHTTFAGAVGQDRIRAYYRSADVFCLASFAEGVPVVLMEAMAMRLPVVATDVMGVRELVEDGVNGIVVRPSRADQLADAITRLAEDAGLRRRLGSAGRDTVRREFDIERSAAQLERVFREIVAPNG